MCADSWDNLLNYWCFSLCSLLLSRSSEWLFISAQANMKSAFMMQLEDIEKENFGFLVLNRCPDDPHHIHKRCKGKTTYHYPDILQVGCLSFLLIILWTTFIIRIISSLFFIGIVLANRCSCKKNGRMCQKCAILCTVISIVNARLWVIFQPLIKKI